MITDLRKSLKRVWLKFILAKLMEEQREANELFRTLPHVQAEIACDIATIRSELMRLRK